MIVGRNADTGAFCSEVDLMWRTDNRQIFLRVQNMLCSLILYICEIEGILSLSAERSWKGSGINFSAGFTCTCCRLSA